MTLPIFWCVILINGGKLVAELSIMEESWHWIQTVHIWDMGKLSSRNVLEFSLCSDNSSIMWFWFGVDFCPVLHVTLHVACMLCVPSLLPQRKSAASLAPQSTMPCVVLGVSWAAASHTQQWCPSTLSSAACRFVWKLNPTVATSSSSSNLSAPWLHVWSSVL